VITPKLLKIPNVSSPNVILNSNLKHPKNKTYHTDSGEMIIIRLANEGLLRIYGNTNVLARARVEKELKVIDELKFSGYFLINWDIIQYSNSMGFMHIGRGSGASNKLLSWYYEHLSARTGLIL
jgi:DNA polymerase III alpha subunit